MKPRILYAEDEEMLRKLFGKIIPSLGYDLLIAEDGLEAFEIFQREQDSISTVLTDIKMPRWDGTKLAREIREKYPESTKPILALTGNMHYFQDPKDRKLFDRVLLKPIGLKDLGKILAEYMPLNKN